MTPDVNDLCVFAVKRGDIQSRVDTAYNHPKYEVVISNLKNHVNLVEFGDIIESISGGATPLRANEEQYTDSGIKFLRIQNITPFGFDFSDVKYITEIVHDNLLKRSQLAENDLLMTITGRIGTCAVVTESCLPANINQHIVRIRLKEGMNPNFVAAYLNSQVGLLLSNRSVTGTTRLALDYDSIKKIPVPVIPFERQGVLATTLDDALKVRNKKIVESNKLLSSVSDIVLDKLGLVFDISKTQMSYAIPLENIDGRLDADYYSPKFSAFRKQIIASRFGDVTIDEISDCIVTGFAAGKQDQADDLLEEQRVPHIRPFSITPEGELSFETKKYVPTKNLKESDYCKKNEVIFNNTNSPELVGKTTVFDSDVLCAASNHMTRITIKDGVNPYYISAFFNVLLNIGYWKLLCTNFNNQAGINIETLKNVRIPLPPKELQDEIVYELMRRRGVVNSLRKEAERDWKEAKLRFEKDLMEG